MAPEGTRYTREHEWVSPTGRDTVRIGITDYAQQQLGDVVFVDLPQVGERLSESATIGEVESTKSVSDLYAPVAGEVVARNELLDDRPELVNAQPHGDGWMLELRLDDPGALENLLDEAAYRAVTEQG